MSRVRLLALVCLVSACNLPEIIVPEPPPPAPKPWVTDPVADAQKAQAAATERQRFTADEGSVTLTASVKGGSAITCIVGLEQVAIRVGDVPSLTYVSGHIKVNPVDIECGSPANATLTRTVLEHMFLSFGAPIQVVFDIGSVDQFVGKLAQPGDKASGVVLGSLQINDHKGDVDVAVGIERQENNALLLTVPDMPLALNGLGLDERLSALAGALHTGAISPKITMSASIHLQAFAGERLPSFIRVPVTVNRAADFEQAVDKEIDDDVVARRRLQQLGFPAGMSAKIGDKQAEAIKKLREHYNRGNDVNFDAQAKRSGTEVAGD